MIALGPKIFCAPPARLDDSVQGQKLAAQLRSLAPTENGEVRGVLRISKSGEEPRVIALTSSITIGKNDWTTTYLARLPDGNEEKLAIHHFTNRPSRYEWSRGGRPQQLSGGEATNSFAGSDFALCDLGLEFIHWPTQVLATKEMRKGRGCYVLESRPATNHLYSRVLLWLDEESLDAGAGPGILFAEAYDARGKLLKEFEVNAFDKARRQVSEMEIRNRQTKTSTRLRFDFDKQ